MAVSPDPSEGLLSDAFMRAGEELGYDTLDLNGPYQMGKYKDLTVHRTTDVIMSSSLRKLDLNVNMKESVLK